jgi:hypothetical protein
LDTPIIPHAFRIDRLLFYLSLVAVCVLIFVFLHGSRLIPLHVFFLPLAFSHCGSVLAPEEEEDEGKSPVLFLKSKYPLVLAFRFYSRWIPCV